MKKGRRGAVLRDCLRKNRVAILLWVLTVLTEWVVFYLYRIMWEPLLYAGALTLALGLLLLGLGTCAGKCRRLGSGCGCGRLF